MKVYGVQLDITWEDKPANHSRVLALLEDAHPEPGSLIVLPEMFATGFSKNLSATLPDENLDEENFLRSVAHRFECTVIGGLVAHAPYGKGWNQALAVDATGSELARYTKIHPFSGAGEDLVHEPGLEIVSFEHGGMRVAPFVCYDLRFPEIFRAAALKGAELLVVIALWPVTRIHHWIALLQARAIENQAYVLGVNRVGEEPGYKYCGRSIAVDPQGHIIADAGEREGVFVAEVLPETVRSWRTDFPALRDAHWRADSTGS